MNLASAVAASSGNATASLSFPKYLSMTIREQGAMSLYSGLSAGLLRQIFYTTSRLGLFEVFRDEMAKYRPTDIWSRLSTGMVSGGAYLFRGTFFTSLKINYNVEDDSFINKVNSVPMNLDSYLSSIFFHLKESVNHDLKIILVEFHIKIVR